MYSVVIPVFNEEANIQPLYQSLTSVMKTIGDYEIIFVDDGSTDSTFTHIKELHTHDKKIKCLRFRKNFGQTPALRAGFDFAHGDYIITIDGDFLVMTHLVNGSFPNFLIGWLAVLPV